MKSSTQITVTVHWSPRQCAGPHDLQRNGIKTSSVSFTVSELWRENWNVTLWRRWWRCWNQMNSVFFFKFWYTLLVQILDWPGCKIWLPMVSVVSMGGPDHSNTPWYDITPAAHVHTVIFIAENSLGHKNAMFMIIIVPIFTTIGSAALYLGVGHKKKHVLFWFH